MLTNRMFWLAALERAIKTAAQVALLALAAQGVEDGGFVLGSVDWLPVASLAAGGAVLSLLTSLASGLVGEHGTPSLTRAETLDPGPELYEVEDPGDGYVGRHRAG